MLAATDIQNYAWLAGLLILVIVMWRMMRRAARRQAEPRLSIARPSGDPAAGQPLRRSVEELLVELQEFRREIDAQLDTKMRALVHLTEEAGRQIERLEALLGVAVGERSPAAPDGPPVAAPPAASLPASAPTDPRHRRVHELADQGFTPVEIARQTGQGLGEVELILSLRAAAAPRRPGPSLDRRT